MLRRRRDLGTTADRVTFDTLHTASLAASPLRGGLTDAGATGAVGHLRTLLGTAAVALTDRTRVLAVDGDTHGHRADPVDHARQVLDTGRTSIVGGLSCGADCPVRIAVAAPVIDGDTVVGALIAYGRGRSAALVRAVEEVARWVSNQVELASADADRTRMAEAELRALRAQISPHFVYNALTAVASFTRTNPDRARELLLEFADFTRYALRGGEFTTLAEELRNTERYLVIEQARFGERVSVSLRVAPEVLPIAVPFLVLQPLVENAVRHGTGAGSGVVHLSILVADDGDAAAVSIEDDGAGADPDVVRAALVRAGAGSGRSIGLGNVDARLRQVYGDEYGLVVETAPGAGTRVAFRVPKFAPGVAAARGTAERPAG